ncbi:type I-B CRISPR-associated protein Cas7/Cst2/DevR [Methanosarcina sp. UBA5]|uniref:type I-B CRISPR-associated protein Cas7/Cst2/DevR n=1 Tax=Methanosarcina sp. UBA5 TaxID=1915593 RepID=UPI0025D35654|nr:type I-B CRISPR-associated protein Cas7/Cst2/DevR [Methanosarcina sp. UBA5]
MDSNCVNITFLFKMSIGNANSGFNEDNISTLKKITLPDGSSLPYISGQAIRRYIRDKFVELGQEISPLQDPRSDEQKIKEAKTKNPDFTECDPVAYIDDDLFGYMRAVKGDTRKRTSSVRVASAIGMYPFQNDRDLGTRSSQQTRVKADAGGSMFETEITHNYFCVNTLIELDRVGKFDALELNGKEGVELEPETKVKRLHTLVTAIEHLWGGGKQSRLLTDISPKFIVYTKQTAKRPIFLETLRMKPDQLDSVDINLLKSSFDANESIVQKAYVGYLPGFFANDKEIKESFDDVLPINECFNLIRKDISSVYIR